MLYVCVGFSFGGTSFDDNELLLARRGHRAIKFSTCERALHIVVIKQALITLAETALLHTSEHWCVCMCVCSYFVFLCTHSNITVF